MKGAQGSEWNHSASEAAVARRAMAASRSSCGIARRRCSSSGGNSPKRLSAVRRALWLAASISPRRDFAAAPAELLVEGLALPPAGVQSQCARAAAPAFAVTRRSCAPPHGGAPAPGQNTVPPMPQYRHRHPPVGVGPLRPASGRDSPAPRALLAACHGSPMAQATPVPAATWPAPPVHPTLRAEEAGPAAPTPRLPQPWATARSRCHCGALQQGTQPDAGTGR